MQTLASTSNQVLKTIAMKKFENVITKTKNYYNVMVNKYGDDFNPYTDDTIMSAVGDFMEFLDTVDKHGVLPKVVVTNSYTRFFDAYTRGE